MTDRPDFSALAPAMMVQLGLTTAFSRQDAEVSAAGRAPMHSKAHAGGVVADSAARLLTATGSAFGWTRSQWLDEQARALIDRDPGILGALIGYSVI